MFTKIYQAIRWRIRRLRRDRVMRRALRVTAGVAPGSGAPHDLPCELIISLTSYRARFDQGLARTIRGLLAQSVRADRIVLWIDPGDAPHVPAEVQALATDTTFEVRTHADIGPATKLIPALKAFPDAAIVTADDDLFYPPDWLATLVTGSITFPGAIVARRAHLARTDADGVLQPYLDWDIGTAETVADNRRSFLFPTGVGGVLYPPRCFGAEVMDEDALLRLTPKADDVWFFWMARRAGVAQRRVGDRFDFLTWPGSQEGGLRHGNVHGGGNDAQIRAMEEAYGLIGNLGADVRGVGTAA